MSTDFHVINVPEKRELLANLDKLHTTSSGAERIRKNLLLETDHVVAWCKTEIISPQAVITRKGKNWYIETAECVITVNANSYTIITAHKAGALRKNI